MSVSCVEGVEEVNTARNKYYSAVKEEINAAGFGGYCCSETLLDLRGSSLMNSIPDLCSASFSPAAL